ncbi:MAG: hypothetical protein NC131_06790 [Roseburia sp.]|nr:hypothetical protein [Roseburia sp.]
MFVYLGVIWGICSVVAAAAFFALTVLFKNLQEDYDKAQALKRHEEERGAEPDKALPPENNGNE